jgi:hypothetical protein
MDVPEGPESLWGRLKSKGEQLYEAVKSSTAHPRAKYLDHERLEIKRQFRTIIERGSEQDLAEALSAMGMGPDTQEGKEFLTEFKKIRGGD